MKLRAALCAVALSVVAGCATQPASTEFKPDVSTMGEDSDARNRARIHTELAGGYFELAIWRCARRGVRGLARGQHVRPATHERTHTAAVKERPARGSRQFERPLR